MIPSWGNRECVALQSKSWPRRRGAALLVCMMAAMVVALAAVALLRAQRRQAVETQMLAVTATERQAAYGLLQCGVARLRFDPGFQGTLTDPALGSQHRLVVQAMAPDRIELRVFLGDAARPYQTLIVDPASL